MTAGAPLAGVRVLELAEGAAAGFCGRQFALWGAEVIMAESLAGSPLRAADLIADKAGRAWSPLFTFFGAGKSAASAAQAKGLLAGVDVLITDLSDTALATAAGVGPAVMRRRSPGLVIVSVTALGDGGASRPIGELEALSGYLSLNGRAEEPPIPAPGRLLEFAVGANAFIGAMGALIGATRTGWGERVDISALESLAALLPFLRVQHFDVDLPRQGGTIEGVRVLPCRDGWVELLTSVPAINAVYAELLGVPPDAVPIDLHGGGAAEVADRAAAVFAPFTARAAMGELFDALQARNIVCGMVRPPAAVLACPQLAARGVIRPPGDRDGDALPWIGPPARLSGWEPLPIAPLRIDAATPDWPPRPVPHGAAPRTAPLAGLTVLDLTQAWIGPFASLQLADLGAEVIKVEGPTHPDIWRTIGQSPRFADAATAALNRSAYFDSTNRGKRSLALDLTRPEGRDLLLRLAADCDILMENYTPGVLPRFGLDAAAFKAAAPDLVVTSFSGFGANGPWREHKAIGSSIEALAGWTALHQDSAGRPVAMGSYPADPVCGLQMAAATLVALFRKLRTGAGGRVDGAMLDAAVGFIGDQLLAATAGEPPRPSRPEAGPFRTLAEALDAPALADWFVRLEKPGLPPFRYNGRGWRFERARLAEPTPPPRLGEHGAAVLAERLGLDAARFAALKADGVTAVVP